MFFLLCKSFITYNSQQKKSFQAAVQLECGDAQNDSTLNSHSRSLWLRSLEAPPGAPPTENGADKEPDPELFGRSRDLGEFLLNVGLAHRLNIYLYAYVYIDI